MKALPDIHTDAFKYKNVRKLQHDGGRAWIKNPQLQVAIKGTGKYIEVAKSESK